MAMISTGGWDTGRPSKSTGVTGRPSGGPAVTKVQLCIDCVSRPRDFGKPGVAPCTLRPAFDVFEARAACKGGNWLRRP